MPDGKLTRFVRLSGWSACAATLLASSAFPGFAREPAVQWLPWLLGLATLGIPHGALDHRVGPELSGRSGRGAGLGFFAGYLAAGGAVLLLWWACPAAALAGFLVLAAYHFGQGDLFASCRDGLAAGTDSVGYRAVLLAARGLLPIALPPLAFPSEFASAASPLVDRFFPSGPGWHAPSWLVPAGIVAVSGVVVFQVAWALVIASRGEDSKRRRAGVVEASETLLLAAMFALVPPVLAVGVYFNAWHSLGHVSRLMEADGRTRVLLAEGRLRLALAAFQRTAMPMTAAAFALLGGLAWFLWDSLESVGDAGLAAVVLLSALTLPHVLVVSWMDLRQGVWPSRAGVES